MSTNSSRDTGLEGRLLRPGVFAKPERLADSAWLEHIPFAFWLVEALRPRSLVELGTHHGVSYCAFLQGAAAIGLDLAAAAVDTWAGDAHTGDYGASVLADLEAFHGPRYGGHSHLLRMTFDEAAPRFEAGSIDLLHIDGLHTYDAVRHDFETWRPKLSRRGVVLFHDIAERRGDFGVWRLWEELAAAYPTFAFEHGHGLGLALIGANPLSAVGWLAGLRPDEAQTVRALFAAIGAQHSAAIREGDAARVQRAQVEAWEAAQARAAVEHAEAAALVAAQARVLDAQARAMSDYAEQFAARDRALAQQAETIARQAALLERRRAQDSAIPAL